MTSRRPERVARQITQALSSIVEKHVGDPRVQTVTFTAARVTPDLRNVRVYYSVLGSEQERAECAKGLASASGYLRREVTRKLGLRFAPVLSFEFDETLDRADRIGSLLGDTGPDGSEGE